VVGFTIGSRGKVPEKICGKRRNNNNNNNIDLRETGSDYVDWIHLAQDRV
jgi:hypothetical protein